MGIQLAINEAIPPLCSEVTIAERHSSGTLPIDNNNSLISESGWERLFESLLYNTEDKPSGPYECDGLTLRNAPSTRTGENDALLIPYI